MRFARNIYLAARTGLRKDAADTLRTAAGFQYGASADNLQHIKSFLGAQYAVPDDMALQVLTHKSFCNGIKPYNEKLSVMGSKVVNLLSAKHVVECGSRDNGSASASASAMAVGGKNLDVLGTPIARELGGRMALGVFAQRSRLNRVMFWKSYNHQLSFEASGELKVSAQMMYAMVGAVAFVHGKAAAERFVREKLMAGEHSLEAIAADYLERK